MLTEDEQEWVESLQLPEGMIVDYVTKNINGEFWGFHIVDDEPHQWSQQPGDTK